MIQYIFSNVKLWTGNANSKLQSKIVLPEIYVFLLHFERLETRNGGWIATTVPSRSNWLCKTGTLQFCGIFLCETPPRFSFYYIFLFPIILPELPQHFWAIYLNFMQLWVACRFPACGTALWEVFVHVLILNILYLMLYFIKCGKTKNSWDIVMHVASNFLTLNKTFSEQQKSCSCAHIVWLTGNSGKCSVLHMFQHSWTKTEKVLQNKISVSTIIKK